MASLTTMDMGLNKLQETVKDREVWLQSTLQSMGSQRVGHNGVTEQQEDI